MQHKVLIEFKTNINMLPTTTILSLTLALVSTGSLEPRIIKGENAIRNEFPYIVSIRRIEDDTHFCAGTIITPSWSLTAAHCFEEECPNCKAKDLVVVSGALNIQDTNACKTRIEKIIPHSDHNFTLRINDLALLKAKKRFYDFFTFFRFNKINKIKIGPIGTNLDVIVAGWGSQSRNSSEISNKLKYTTLWTTESDQFCTNSIFFVCANVLNGGGACEGDCGGPVIDRNGKEDALVGIVTHWHDQCAPGHPERFTRVYPFRKWIKEQIGSEKYSL